MFWNAAARERKRERERRETLTGVGREKRAALAVDDFLHDEHVL